MIHLEDLICEFSADQDINEEKLTEQLEKQEIGCRAFIRWLVNRLDVSESYNRFLEKELDRPEEFNEEIEYSVPFDNWGKNL
jgi:hypothetical protein